MGPCLTCAQPGARPGGDGCCIICGSPWPRETTPATYDQPDAMVGFSEQSIGPFDEIENGTIIVDQREGFVPCVTWLSYSVESKGTEAVAPHRVRIDAFAGRVPADPTSPQYTLLNDDVRYFTVATDGYHGIPLPFLGGGAQPFGFRISTGAPIGFPRTFRVAWGYRARVSINTGVAGAG